MSIRSCCNLFATCGLVSILALYAGVGDAWAQVRQFNIPSKPADQAIVDFARQSGIQVIAPASRLRGVTAPAIRGDLDAREALSRLLSNTGLEIASDTGALIVLRAAAPRETAHATIIPDIVVTAGRVESLASKTPIAVTAIGGEYLASIGVSNPTQLSGIVPNLVINRANGLQITIRGVTSTDGTEKGDPSASFLLDGVYIARPQAQDVPLYDLDRVEVSRGPQGTLYGRNTTAGVVNVISVEPKSTYGSSLDVNVGNYGALQATGVANFPITDDLAVRIAANYDTRNSYLTQAVPQPVSDPELTDTQSVRMSALFAPNDRLEIKAVIDGSVLAGGQPGVLLSNYFAAPFAAPADGARGVDPAYLNPSAATALTKGYASVQNGVIDNQMWGGLTQATYAPNENWTLVWLGSYREFTRYELGNSYQGSLMSTGGAVLSSFVFPDIFDGWYNQNSQELRAAYAGQRLKAQAGFYYFREKYDVSLFIVGLQGAPGERGYYFGFPQSGWARSTGLFGQVEYALTDRLRVTVGGRTTNDSKFREGATVFHAGLDEPNNFTTSTAPGVANPQNFRDSLNRAKIDTTRPTWKFGADFDLTPSHMIYAAASTGYKAGGFNDGCLAGQANCNSPLPAETLLYQPEKIIGYELGVKSRLFADRMQVSAGYFKYRYENLQISQLSDICGGPCQITTNAAEAEINGFELEGAAAITNRGRLAFSATWLDARYEDWPLLPGFNFAGAALDRSPEWTLSGSYTHTQPLPNGADLVFDLRTRYSDQYALLSSALRAQFWQPAYSKSDASVTYKSNKFWQVQAYVRNIENAVELTGAGVTAGFPGVNNGAAAPGEPRTWGLRLTAQF